MANNEIFFEERKFIVSKMGETGHIAYGNDLLISISGYAEKELIGSSHNILHHPDMPKIIFKILWEAVEAKNEIFAYVKNKTKNNDYYWVFTHLTPSMDNHGNIIGHHSVRRKPTSKALETIKALYQKLLSAENRGGINASEKMLQSLLKTQGLNYNEYILSL